MTDGGGFVTRAVVFTLDPSPAQERLLRSYCGAARFAYNWVLSEVTANIKVRAAEREAGVPDADLSVPVSWSKFSLRKRFNQVKGVVAPWSGEVAKHCFDTGVSQAAVALKNWKASTNGTRKGARVGFPSFKSRHRSKLSVSFVELNHQLSWLHDSRHAVRLMLPQALVQSKDQHTRRKVQQLVWVHTVESTRRLYRLVEDGRASIQCATFSYSGGRWQVSFTVRYKVDARPVKRARRREGGVVGVDVGLTHLATLSRPIPGVTDGHGHVPNPRPLTKELAKLQDVDRRIARSQRFSHNRARLVRRRARLHGTISAIRKTAHHRLADELAARFDTVIIEDLNVKGMTHNRPLARALADAGLGQFRQILTTECADRDTRLVTVDRWFPSSKTCSACGAVKAKLPLDIRVFDCDTCGTVLDRDVNAALNLEHAPMRVPDRCTLQSAVAGLRPETRNADPRPHKTEPTPVGAAVAA